MPKKKVAVALSDWLLDELDRAASSAGASRSALVEEAVADYVVRRSKHEGERRFRADVEFALEDMKRFANEYDADGSATREPSSLEKLRALRAEGRGINE